MDLKQLQEEVIPWIERSIEKEGLKDHKIEVTGTSKKGDNFAGEVIYVKVTGNENVELNLVVKLGRNDSVMGKYLSEWYYREVAVYRDILPAFQKYQQEQGVKVFKSFPSSYYTMNSENQQVIILENLTDSGFQMHDKSHPMNMQHLRLVLENYANFHAVSFAMRDRDKEVFRKLTENYDNISVKLHTSERYFQYVRRGVKKVVKLVREEDTKLADAIEKFFENEVEEAVKFGLERAVDEKDMVITHGDCWNNNYMFQYQDGDKDTPTDLRIIDWQLSILYSPALDLSYFIYANASEAQLSRFDELIGFYHDCLSRNLRKYGCDPNKIFTLEKLLKHWDNVSAFAVCFVCGVLEMVLGDKEDVEGDELKVRDVDGFRKRVSAATRHYLRRTKRLV